jgi:hypothetical protein
MTGIPIQRPIEIKRAQLILWAWTAWTCLYGLYQTINGTSGTDAMFGQALSAIVEIPPGTMRTAIIIAYAAVALGMFGVIAQIGHGRRWARVTLLISFIFEILLFAGPPDGGALGYLALVPDLGLQAAALYLLYTSPGRNWFATAKS